MISYVSLLSLFLPASAKRQSSILFTCDQSAGHGSPQLVSETAGCSVTFQWKTNAVCPPRKMECKLVSQHHTFDLRALSSLTKPWTFSHKGDSWVQICFPYFLGLGRKSLVYPENLVSISWILTVLNTTVLRYNINLCQEIHGGSTACPDGAAVCRRTAAGLNQTLGRVYTQKMSYSGGL